MLGKDFISALIILHFFLTRSPCRIVTTSAKDEHLIVLWGEMKNFIRTASIPLEIWRGPLLVKHHEILKFKRARGDDRSWPEARKEPETKSYIKGMVANDASIAAMGGHHVAQTGDGIPRTLFVADECSSIPDSYWEKAITWANRSLLIGNAWPAENFFKRAFKGSPGTNDKGGDILAS